MAECICRLCHHHRIEGEALRAQVAALTAERDRANARAAREEQATLAALADADEQRARAEAAEHTFRCVEESEQYLALRKLAEARAKALEEALRKALNESGCDGDLCCHEWHDAARAALGDG